MKKPDSSWVAVGLVVVLLAVGGGLWLTARGPRHVDDPESAHPGSKLTALKGMRGLGGGGRKVEIKPVVRGEGAFDPYVEWETGEVLDHFAVPTIKFDGVMLEEALVSIRELYAAYGGHNLNFRVVGEGAGFPLEFESGGSLRAVLELMAGLGGFELNIEGREIVFTRKDDSDHRLDVLRIGNQIGAGASVDPAGSEGGGAFAADSPFGEGDPSPDRPMATIDPIGLLVDYGIAFSGGAGIEIDPETGDWLITQTPAQLGRIRAVHEAYANPSQLRAGQILISFENQMAANEIPFEAQTFADQAVFQEAVGSLDEDGSRAGVSAPSIVTSNGQRAKVEIIREAIFPSEIDGAGEPTAFEARNVGLTVDVEPVLAGIDRVALVGTVEYVTVGDQSLENLFEDSGTWPLRSVVGEEDFHSHLVDFDGQLIDGNVTGFRAADDQESMIRQFITTRRLNPDGTPLLGGAEPSLQEAVDGRAGGSD
ncbi:MAG: hypothetical protein ACR2RV_14275 [Verrucomicrobiales bacterium]